jgi:hypothetical protein
MTNLLKDGAATLRKAGVTYFTLYEVRHTFATRLSWRHRRSQGDAAAATGGAEVFKLYSQAKLGMMRDRDANEQSSNVRTVN